MRAEPRASRAAAAALCVLLTAGAPVLARSAPWGSPDRMPAIYAELAGRN